MTETFHLEEFSSGLKAKLDVKHRRKQDQQFQITKFETNFNPGKNKSTLPFTTRTKAFGTYDWRKKS